MLESLYVSDEQKDERESIFSISQFEKLYNSEILSHLAPNQEIILLRLAVFMF